jgi:hypothetical protein
MKSIAGKNLGLALVTALFFGINFNANAQPTRTFRPGTNALYALLLNPALSNSPVAVATIKEVLATTPAPMSVPVFSATNHSAGGTYWTMQSPVPLPGDFFPDLPVYLLDSINRTFLIDDRSVDYATLEAELAAENATNGSGERFHAYDLTIDTNRLWLSVATNALPGSNMFNVVIHETVTGNYYDVLTKADLLRPTWAVETTVVGADGNETPVTLEQNDRTNLFVWARDSIIAIYTQPLPQEVYSGDSVTFTVGAGGSGLFYQWTFNGTNIYGATDSSYTILNVNGNNAGDYACIVQNADGSVTTQAATLTVDQGSGWPYDMSTIGQRQDYVFHSGVTYNITSPIQLFGETTIEAGAIIKFDYNGLYPCLQIMGTLDCEGTPCNPSVMTSVDDDTFGLAEQDSTGSPQPVFTGVPFLDLTYAGNVSLSNLRFRYADIALGAPYFARVDVWDSQFVQCNASVLNEFGGTDGFHNVLFAGCYDAVAGDTNAYAVEMEQVTADVANVWDSTASPSRLALTNTIVFGSVGSVSGYSAQNVTVAPAATEFQTNGTGIYYLAAASSLHQSGTTNISARLRTELQQKTTSPPLALPQLMNLSGDLTLLPQAARYTNGLPDRGYYYDALDYTVAFMTVSGSLTVEPGTVIGVRNEPVSGGSGYTYWGLDLRENSSFVSHGFPNRPNIITDVQNVQEQDEYGSSSLIVPDFEGASSDAAPSMDMRFCKLYASAGNFAVWGGDWEFVAYGDNLASYNSLVNWTMRDCEIHGGRISLGLPDSQIDLTQYYGSGAVDWENNLFEDVNINLNPATWWYNGVVNFDESLTARNNLFKGANWVALEPVPASAGNWTFTDNLFDGIDFQTDPAAPLDFDYNGYYPLPVSQELYNTLAYQLSLTAGDSTSLFSATNDLDGLHEVYLDYALPYGSGPFGKYYLTSITPLWQAGSRTASDAGLSQYTTSTSEGKDAANYPVNIGYHYVAATNSLPLDSDGDGIPDYVEVENGTDPYNPMTDGVTPDAFNSAYDNVDLSGNCLVGRIKNALGQNPLATTNPITLTQVAWDDDYGIATFKIPISYATITNLGSLNLFLDGACVGMQDLSPASDGNTLLLWNTTFNASTSHLLQAQIDAKLSADDTATLTAVGSVLPFSSDNPVQFYESDGVYDDTSAFLDALIVSSTNQYYTIQIFDPSTTPEIFVKGITNSTSNGMIQEDWDLTYDDGVTTFTGDSFDAVFTVSDTDPSASASGGSGPTPLDAHPSKKRTKKHTRMGSTEQGNGFDLSYVYTPANSSMAFDFSDEVGAVRVGMQNVVDTALMPVTADGGHDDHYDSDFNRYTSQRFPGDVGVPGYMTSQSQVFNSLYPSMTNGTTKNFFVYAHGDGSSVGSYDFGVTLFAPEVAGVLNNYYSGAKIIKASYPYRFVFLDGCSTASTREWRQAFGIFPLWDSSSPARGKIGAQAYVGWAHKVTGWLNPKDDSTLSENVAFAYTEALADMYELWMDGRPLATCIDSVSVPQENIAPFPVPGLKGKSIHIWGEAGSDGYPYNYMVPPSAVLTSPIYIIGHSGLERSSYDRRFDNLPRYNSPVDVP